ncbi:hypothetical protein [Saccharomonospora piscinae]|nr:hypothetical protein [Saccharomonospora piscinae]
MTWQEGTMLWLFGEIWLWLLIAFVVGGVLAAVILRSVRTRSGAAGTGEPATGSEQGRYAASGRPEPEPEAERTQRIQRVAPQLRFGEPPPRARPEPDDVPDEGSTHGILPLTASEWHARNEWPDDRDIAVAEENRPRRDR